MIYGKLTWQLNDCWEIALCSCFRRAWKNTTWTVKDLGEI
jgi:hypothetical protein